MQCSQQQQFLRSGVSSAINRRISDSFARMRGSRYRILEDGRFANRPYQISLVDSHPALRADLS